MKKVIAFAACAVALAAVAGQAQAAASPEQRIAALERQVATLTRALAAPQAQNQTPADRKIAALTRSVTALTRRATALEKRVKKAETTVAETTLVAAAGLIYAGCLSAVTADALNGTWNVVDQIAAATQAGKVYFGPQAAVSDFNICQALQITRQTSIPPSMANFSALTALLGSRYSGLSAGF